MCVAGGFGEGSGTVLIFEALVCSTRMGRHGNNLTARSSLCLGRVCAESQQNTTKQNLQANATGGEVSAKSTGQGALPTVGDPARHQ